MGVLSRRASAPRYDPTMHLPEIHVSAVVIRDPHNRVLTVRKRGTDKFMFPGGKPEPGELALQTAVREVREEIGVVVDESLLTQLGVFEAPAANEADHTVVATVYLYPGTVVPKVAGEIEEIAWADVDKPAACVAPLLADEVFPALAANPIRSVAVFAGASSSGVHGDLARSLGRALAEDRIGLVYGGGKVGLMGTVADAAIEKGGTAIGVIPQHLVDGEIAHPELNSLIVVDTMSTRKQKMSDLADAFVCLPGGTGTLDEFFDVWTGQQLGLHSKPIALLGCDYWEPLLAMLDRMVADGYVRAEDRKALVVADTPADILAEMRQWVAPAPKWARS